MKRYALLFLALSAASPSLSGAADLKTNIYSQAKKHAGSFSLIGLAGTLGVAIAAGVVRTKQDKVYRLKKTLKMKRLELKRLLNKQARQAVLQTAQEKIDSLATGIQVQVLSQEHARAAFLAKKAEALFHRLLKAALFVGGATGGAVALWAAQKYPAKQHAAEAEQPNV